jgi:hypothetical protein
MDLSYYIIANGENKTIALGVKNCYHMGSKNAFCARSEGVITPPCHGGDRRFKSGRARHETTSSYDGVFSWEHAVSSSYGGILVLFS